jgi:transcriptional regulator with XRE-family HTH domain
MSLQRLTNRASIDTELADLLDRDPSFQRQYVKAFAQAAVASEIRGLRKRRKLKQADVARLVKTGQSAISRIEKADYDGWTFKTLLAIAIELRARLRVTLEPLEDVTGQLRGTDTGVDISFDDTATTLEDADLEGASTTAAPLTDNGGTAYDRTVN